MAVPKRRKSKMKRKMRQGSARWRAPKLQVCGECGSRTPGHIACPTCGFYNGRQVLEIDAN